MRFLAGSHHFGYLTYRPSDPSEHNVLNQTIENVERFGEPADVELKAGEISIHSDLLLHGSEANDSDRRRCGLTLRYCAADVRAGLGWNAKGVVVSWADAPITGPIRGGLPMIACDYFPLSGYDSHFSRFWPTNPSSVRCG